MAAINPQTFTNNTPATILNQFLQQLAQDPQNQFTIHQRVVSYKSEANKQSHISRQTTDEARAEYQACDRIQVLKGTLRVQGTIVWLSGSLFHIGDTGADDDWHSYVMIYHEREVVIVDPEYAGVVAGQDQRRVRHMSGLGLLVELLPYMYKGKKERVNGSAAWGRPIDRVRIGRTGFGVPGQQMCNSMTGQWVQSFIQAGCPMEWFDGWEELRMR
jgi:hypothetical protein